MIDTEETSLKKRFYSKIRPQKTREIQEEDELTLMRENSITKKAVLMLNNMRKQQSNDEFIIKQIKDPQTTKHRGKLRQVMENNLISEDGRKGYHKLRQKKAKRKFTYSMPQLTMKLDEEKKDEEEGRALTITSSSARDEEAE